MERNSANVRDLVFAILYFVTTICGLILLAIFFGLIVTGIVGCTPEKKSDCPEFYCPYDGNIPLDCYCLQEMTMGFHQ